MLNKKFKEVIKNLEENIENKDDLNYAKAQITELSMTFLDELEKMETSFQHKLSVCEDKIDVLEMTVQKIEEEIFQDDISMDFEPIKCPYCNSNFLIESDNSQKEIKCPDCKNIIELDWGNFDDDM